ncbi:MAG: GNAT family N-acetyltransferase [Pikeienuella sp.]
MSQFLSGQGLPVILTPRLRLRPRRMADLAACLAMDREPGTARWIDGPWDDQAAHEAFVRARIRGPYPAGMGYWVIARQSHPQAFLGWVLLIPEDAVGPRIEIGWRVVTSARGQGYAPEAAANLLNHGFGRVGLTRVVAEIHRENRPSVRVAEKIGMRLAEDPSRRDPPRPDHLLYEARLDCAK